ncbi:MAG: hypothetical protein R3191_07570 [Anaerolineales bacterium]|nr:hypothetical protein [Anaerolineales bacterium]
MTSPRATGPRTLVVAIIITACAACSPAPASPTATAAPSPTITPTVPFPTLAPSPTEVPPSSPVPPPEVAAGSGQTVYETSFDHAGDWPLGQDALGTTSLLEGSLSVVVSAPQSTRTVASPAPPQRDLVLQATFTPQLCSPDDEYGLYFRRTPDDTYLRFTVTCSGAVRARRVTADGPRAVVPFLEEHPAVIPGAPARNRLAVRALGDTVRLYVNEVQVLTFTDPTPLPGHSGVVVTSDRDGQTTLFVADYTLSDLAPTPTAEATQPTEAPDG